MPCRCRVAVDAVFGKKENRSWVDQRAVATGAAALVVGRRPAGTTTSAEGLQLIVEAVYVGDGHVDQN